MGAFFFSLDGIDGTGKTTQCRLLVDWLRSRGFGVTACTDPGGTVVGKILRDLLLDQRHAITPTCEALLFMASRAQLVSEVIGPALEAGRIVVSDRYLLANVAYQGHAGGIAPDRLWDLGLFASGGLEPDLTLVLDMPVEKALTRRKGPADRVESRDFEYHKLVRDGFQAEARRWPESIRVVDAAAPVETVHERIIEEVSRVLAAHPRA